jgi:short-subunit dehydrogenase
LSNQLRIVITGASGGIGREFIKKLKPYAAMMIINGLLHHELEQIKHEYQLENCFCVAGDIADPKVREKIYQTAHEQGGINLLVNNAGFNEFKLFEIQTDEIVEKIIYSNLTAPMLLSKKLIPLLKLNHSQIINTGSIFGYLGYPGFVSYSASKFGLRGFGQALRRELGDTKIIVRYFAPRATKTKFNNSTIEQLNREIKTAMDSPEEVAQEFIKFLFQKTWQKKIGFKESFFVFINDLFPSLPDGGIIKQLPIIKKYLQRED